MTKEQILLLRNYLLMRGFKNISQDKTFAIPIASETKLNEFTFNIYAETPTGIKCYFSTISKSCQLQKLEIDTKIQKIKRRKEQFPECQFFLLFQVDEETENYLLKKKTDIESNEITLLVCNNKGINEFQWNEF